MGFVETVVVREPWDVDRRLSEMDLTRAGLLAARDVAVLESANATAFHPANAPGTFSYHYGTWSLRDQFVGKAGWVLDRADGIEAIRNDRLKLKVAFCNVDEACNDFHSPKPRSEKGAGAKRACGGSLFGELPQFAARPAGDYALYYLMVDENGAAELTRPVVKAGTFVAIERLYLSDGGDDGLKLLGEDSDGGSAAHFDPQVIRKA